VEKLLFPSCCSNRIDVPAIPAVTNPIATHSWLGEQHGEEAKDEGSEEDREEEDAQEEVAISSFDGLRYRNDIDDRVKRAGAR
jgi:hypothetical protein